MKESTISPHLNGHETPKLIYRRVEHDLRSRINNGHWQVGVMLPSRKALALEYGIDLRTLQQAIAPLIREGKLRADSRRGTFVAERPVGVTSAAIPEPGMHSDFTLGIIADLPAQVPGLLVKDQFKVRIAVHAMERAFSDVGATTHFFNSGQADGSRISVFDAIAALTAEGVNGIAIVFHDEFEVIEEAVRAVGRSPVPLTYVSSRALEAPFPHVFYDSWDAGYQAAQHLIERGYRDLMFFAPFKADWSDDRLEGALAAVRHRGLRPEALRISPCDRPPRDLAVDQFDAGLNNAPMVLAAIKEVRSPLGIIAASDALARGLLQASVETGLEAGMDFGLVGFDDAPEARLCGLTSLRPPLEAMGNRAARLLLDAVQGHQVTMHVRLRSHIVPRTSTRSVRENSVVANSDLDRGME
jgi:DNA-binding LacI/PurR family transcriptional regulator